MEFHELDTPVPVYCSRTTCRWKKFRNGSDTATSLLRQIFTLILTINQKYLRQKQCWQDWAWVDVQHSSILNNEKSLTKPSFARLPSMAETVGFEPTSPIKRANRFRVLSVEHHFEENKGRTEKLREDKNTNNSSIFRLFSVKNQGVSRVRMNHANLLKNGHFGEI